MDEKGFPPRGENNEKILKTIPQNLKNMSVLDLGCNAGYFSIKSKERGAKYVCGIDCNELYIKQAKFCAEAKNLDIEYFKMDVGAISNLNRKFNVVLCIGLLYHLTDLHNAIKAICSVCTNFVLVETAACASPMLDSTVPLAVVGDTSGFPGHWHPNIACLRALFKVYGQFNKSQVVFKGARTCVLFTK